MIIHKFKVNDIVSMSRSVGIEGYENRVITKVHDNGYSHKKGFIPKQDEHLWEKKTKQEK